MPCSKLLFWFQSAISAGIPSHFSYFIEIPAKRLGFPRIFLVLGKDAALGGKDSSAACRCRLFPAKEPPITRLFCGKLSVKIRHPMTLCHPVSQCRFLSLMFVSACVNVSVYVCLSVCVCLCVSVYVCAKVSVCFCWGHCAFCNPGVYVCV